mmetsp:Transcript_15034/g.46672  ORF Transcript_15034/g.46672 Transcript_15034/m.46672 type:complete len:849 (+) Transcript_15034:639-3185(+)
MNWFGTTDKKVYGGVRRKKLFKAWPPPLPTDDDLVEGWDARQQSAWATPGGESEHDDETVQGGLGLGGDINWLRDVMVRSCVSNFGQIVVPIPIRWHLSRRFRLLSWCTNFGFRCTVTNGPAYLEISVLGVTELLTGLAERPSLKTGVHQGIEAKSMEYVCETYTEQSTSGGALKQQPISGRARKNAATSPRALTARRVPARAWADGLRRDVVGAWFSGEKHLGRLILESGAESRGGACVVDLVTSQRGALVTVLVAVVRAGLTCGLTVAIQGMTSSESVFATACGAWPQGIVVRGAYDDFYIPPQLVEARLPELGKLIPPRFCRCPTLPIGAWVKVLRFYSGPILASSACFGLARAAELVTAEGARTLVATPKLTTAPRSWLAVSHEFPHAKLLAEGAFKKVYAASGQAVGVTDISLAGTNTNTGDEAAKELEISCLLTQLALRRCCPNFVNLIKAFVCHDPPGAAWGVDCEDTSTGLWLYACMGLCNYGDIESWLRKQANGALPEDAALQLLFQICFALYVSRAVIGLRHYDVKLLNVLVSPIGTSAVTARYHLGTSTYDVRLLQHKSGAWAKLADFGTSYVDCLSFGRPTRGAVLTTLENTPLDILFGGDGQDTHAFAHDTFSLGLAVLHLAGGGAPYEELMRSCSCPDNLCRALAAIWCRSKGSDATYCAMASINCGLDIETDTLDFDRTLFDTVYRQLVLLGIPTHGDDTISKLGPGAAAVLHAARTCLLGDTRRFYEDKQAMKVHRRVQQRFTKHSHDFNLETGINPIVFRCRRRLGSSFDVLKSMLDLDPRKRPTMRAILSSSLFKSLRMSSARENDEAASSSLAFDRFKDLGGSHVISDV